MALVPVLLSSLHVLFTTLMFIHVHLCRNQLKFRLCQSLFWSQATEGTICSFLYIPLFDSLSQLLQNQEIVREVHTVRDSDFMLLKDCSDGSNCKNHPLIAGDITALQIIAYFDELEVTNPIGS